MFPYSCRHIVPSEKKRKKVAIGSQAEATGRRIGVALEPFGYTGECKS
jgi:hypothetical protein